MAKHKLIPAKEHAMKERFDGLNEILALPELATEKASDKKDKLSQDNIFKLQTEIAKYTDPKGNKKKPTDKETEKRLNELHTITNVLLIAATNKLQTKLKAELSNAYTNSVIPQEYRTLAYLEPRNAKRLYQFFLDIKKALQEFPQKQQNVSQPSSPASSSAIHASSLPPQDSSFSYMQTSKPNALPITAEALVSKHSSPPATPKIAYTKQQVIESRDLLLAIHTSPYGVRLNHAIVESISKIQESSLPEIVDASSLVLIKESVRQALIKRLHTAAKAIVDIDNRANGQSQFAEIIPMLKGKDPKTLSLANLFALNTGIRSAIVRYNKQTTNGFATHSEASSSPSPASSSTPVDVAEQPKPNAEIGFKLNILKIKNKLLDINNDPAGAKLDETDLKLLNDLTPELLSGLDRERIKVVTQKLREISEKVTLEVRKTSAENQYKTMSLDELLEVVENTQPSTPTPTPQDGALTSFPTSLIFSGINALEQVSTSPLPAAMSDESPYKLHYEAGSVEILPFPMPGTDKSGNDALDEVLSQVDQLSQSQSSSTSTSSSTPTRPIAEEPVTEQTVNLISIEELRRILPPPLTGRARGNPPPMPFLPPLTPEDIPEPSEPAPEPPMPNGIYGVHMSEAESNTQSSTPSPKHEGREEQLSSRSSQSNSDESSNDIENSDESSKEIGVVTTSVLPKHSARTTNIQDAINLSHSRAIGDSFDEDDRPKLFFSELVINPQGNGGKGASKAARHNIPSSSPATSSSSQAPGKHARRELRRRQGQSKVTSVMAEDSPLDSVKKDPSQKLTPEEIARNNRNKLPPRIQRINTQINTNNAWREGIKEDARKKRAAEKEAQKAARRAERKDSLWSCFGGGGKSSSSSQSRS